jgi:hypothetical protein
MEFDGVARVCSLVKLVSGLEQSQGRGKQDSILVIHASFF